MTSSGNYTYGERRTYTPAVDLSGKEGYFVSLSTTPTDPPRSVRLSTSGTTALGVITHAGQGGVPGTPPGVAISTVPRYCTVQLSGTATCVAGAAIAMGAAVTVNGSGRVITAVSTNTIVGYAEEAALAANEPVSINLRARGAAAA